MAVEVFALGQVGFRLKFDSAVVYIDPYLTDYVADKFGESLRRMVPSPISPADVTDADWVLLTHEHEDHVDPVTIAAVAFASPQCRFMCPPTVVPILKHAIPALSEERIEITTEEWTGVAAGVSVQAVPAAHPHIERDSKGRLSRVGYVIRSARQVFYHAGDTSPDAEIVEAVTRLGPIDYAFLPVNERNYYRDRAGIIGNMSVREAFQFAKEIGARHVVPTHWDLFQPNSTPRAEIELLHNLLRPSFLLRFVEAGATAVLS